MRVVSLVRRYLPSVTVASGVASAVVLVVILLAVSGLLVPPADVEAAPPVGVSVSQGSTSLVCPGPAELVSGDGVTFDSEFGQEAASSSTLVEAFALGRPGGPAPAGGYRPGLDGDAERVGLVPERSLGSGLSVPDVSGPGVLTAQAADSRAALLAGATLARADSGDLRALASERCLEPAGSAWLITGNTEIGSSARLVLLNPGRTSATVDLEAWGAVGPVDLGAAVSVLVPPGSERALLLEAFAPDEPQLAVRLTVSGGGVAAFVQSSSLDGFVPAGVDLSGPSEAPATTVVIPGVVIEDSDIDAAHPSVLRVVNPGSSPATVRLRMLHADGERLIPGAATRIVEAGTVSDISLAGVPAGDYAAELVSDQPVTAAALLTRVGSASEDDPDLEVLDRAWLPAGATFRTALVPIPSLGQEVDSARVVVANAGAHQVGLQYRVVESGGWVRSASVVAVPARSVAVLTGEDLQGAIGVELVALRTAGADDGVVDDPGLVASVVLEADTADGPLVAGVGAQPDAESAGTVAVRLPNR